MATHLDNTHSQYGKLLLILLFVVTLNFIGISIPFPIFAPLFLHATHAGFASLHLSQTAAKYLLGVTLALYPLGQFIGAPCIGSLSDYLSRKFALITTLLALTIGFLTTGLAIQLHNLWLLFLSRFVTGLLATSFIITQAYIVDLQIDKHKGFGAISAAASIGSLVGPLMGGLLSNSQLISWFNYATPFYFAIIPTLIAVLLCFILLPNTKPKRQAASLIRQLNFLSHFSKAIKNPHIKWFIIVSIFLYLGIDTFYEFYPAFLVVHFAFTATHISIVMVILCIGLTIGSYFLSHKFSRRHSPTIIVYTNLAIIICVIALFIALKYRLLLYPEFAVLGVCFGIINTVIIVLISNAANSHEQGEIMGVRFSLRMLGDSTTSFVGGFLLSVSAALPMVLSVLAFLFCLIIFRYLQQRRYLI